MRLGSVTNPTPSHPAALPAGILRNPRALGTQGDSSGTQVLTCLNIARLSVLPHPRLATYPILTRVCARATNKRSERKPKEVPPAIKGKLQMHFFLASGTLIKEMTEREAGRAATTRGAGLPSADSDLLAEPTLRESVCGGCRSSCIKHQGDLATWTAGPGKGGSRRPRHWLGVTVTCLTQQGNARGLRPRDG